MEDHASKLKGLSWLVAALVVGVGCAVGLKPLAHAVPWSWEKNAGYLLDWDLPYQECRSNPYADQLMQRIVKRLYPIQSSDDFPIDVRIVKSPIINAYAGLGGIISVNVGLLKQVQSPEEMAGILAHEIGHVRHRHIMQGVITHLFTGQGFSWMFDADSMAANWTQYFMKMDFTRAQEAQADEDGLKRLQLAHIDNAGLKRFFLRMEQSDAPITFISDHPSHQSRIETIDSYSNQNDMPILTENEWKVLKTYCQE